MTSTRRSAFNCCTWVELRHLHTSVLFGHEKIFHWFVGMRLEALSLQPVCSLQTLLAYVNPTKPFASSDCFHVVITTAFVWRRPEENRDGRYKGKRNRQYSVEGFEARSFLLWPELVRLLLDRVVESKSYSGVGECRVGKRRICTGF
jgi:hypothetical protein